MSGSRGKCRDANYLGPTTGTRIRGHRILNLLCAEIREQGIPRTGWIVACSRLRNPGQRGQVMIPSNSVHE
jgi:hypothetical protein